ncbi:DUF4062 domain-containing protein [Mycobacterium marinum]|uniref:DUF4062 domain-containing protein n=1 Tax=Mycobacterium marinum TaxID=1781 RepID=UPI0018CA2C27|nr:DUF4062 domain-containing protein [Mycobacterium marinum]
MDKRYQVFVSSTYRDLTEERAAVIQAILGLDHFPAGMELFPAADDDQWTLIKRIIDESDYYVVVVAGRYGSLSAEGISYTEKEYDYAVETGVPILGFVHGEPDKIEVGKSESSAKARKSLAEFRAKVESRMVKHFTNADQLGGLVTTSLVREIRNNPRVGWVRGDKAMTPDTEREILTLRAELAEARQKSQSLESSQGIDRERLSEGEDTVSARLRVYSNSYADDTDIWVTASVTWNSILEAIGPTLIDEATEKEFRSKLVSRLYRGKMSSDDRQAVKSVTRRVTVIADSDFDRISVHLRSLGLIESGLKRRQISDANKYLRLTPIGQQELARLIAVTKAEESEAKRPPAVKTATKKAEPKKAATKKTSVQETTATKKASAQKVTTRRAPAKSAAAKKSPK